MTLTEFLLARLDEDEQKIMALLRRAQDHELMTQDPQLLGHTVPGWYDWPEVQQISARVLAEVDAKRRIVAMMDGSEDFQNAMPRPGYAQPYHSPSIDVLIMTARLLALPFAGHPDYDESWRP